MSDNNRTGKRASEAKAEHQAWADQQPTVTRCQCGWTYTGTASEGRANAKAHRADAHPGIKPTRRRRGSLQRFAPQDDGFQQAGIANARKVAESLKRLEDEAAA